MRHVTIQDYLAIAVPVEEALTEDGEITEEFRQQLTNAAANTVWVQYGSRQPAEILLEEITWLVTDDPDVVESHQPAHDCPECRRGNLRARTFLTNNPGRQIALGNVTYTEVWPE